MSAELVQAEDSAGRPGYYEELEAVRATVSAPK
jgi:hypothetical protein